MKISRLTSFLFAALLAMISLVAIAADSMKMGDSMKVDSQKASIKILSPANHAQLDAGEEYPLKYEVIPGPGGDHFHVWVDDDRGPGVHDAKGTYMLPKLSPGTHTITIKVVDKGHVPTGPEQSITVTAK
jgi:hypothetical protein